MIGLIDSGTEPTDRRRIDRVILADPGLDGSTGHYQTYAAAVRRGIEAAGCSFEQIGTRDALEAIPGSSMSSTRSFQRSFRHSLGPRGRRVVNSVLGAQTRPGIRGATRRALSRLAPALANAFAYREFRAILPSDDYSDCLLYLPTMDHRYAIGLAAFLRRLGPKRAPQVCLMWRLPYFNTAGIRPDRLPVWPRLAFRTLQGLRPRYRLRLAVENERLATEYGWMTDLPIELFPIPLSIIEARRKSTSGNTLTVACLGDARPEKGFDVVVKTIELLRGSDVWPKVRFVVQCEAMSESSRQMVAAALPRLADRNVRLIQSPITRAEYEDVLVESDILLLPYDRAAYWSRTSYALAEAMTLGIPVIVTSNTWMSDQVREYKSGLEISGSAQSAVVAIESMVRSYPEAAEAGRIAAAQWRSRHNAEMLAKALLDGAIGCR